MDSGRLRHRVSIQKATETRDAAGGVIQSWATVAKRWASIQPATGKERIEADQVESRITHKITMRHYTNLSPEYRIEHNGRLFGVVSVANLDDRGIFNEVMALEDL